MFNAKSKPTTSCTKAEWVTPAASVPTIFKLKVFCTSLLAVTVKAAPDAVGVSVAGEGTQVSGTPSAQLTFTGLL